MAGRAVFQIKLCAWGSSDLGLIHALLFAQSAGPVPCLQSPGTGWDLAVLPRSNGLIFPPHQLFCLSLFAVSTPVRLGRCTRTFGTLALLGALGLRYHEPFIVCFLGLI